MTAKVIGEGGFGLFPFTFHSLNMQSPESGRAALGAV